MEQLLQDPTYSVKAMARSPSALTQLVEASQGRLTVLKGNLFDKASVKSTIQGCDLVVFAAGVASVSQAMKNTTTIYSVGGQNVLDAMKELGVSRLIAITSQGCIHDPGAPWIYTYFVKAFLMRYVCLCCYVTS
jgi:nucleoside-diphosphate-sugar epimerase